MKRWKNVRYTNDPVSDFLHHDTEQTRKLERLPVCTDCGHHIQDEHCYQINDEVICEDCMREYRVYTDDLIN